MKQKFLTLMCLALCYSADAQFFNQGGTVVIEANAKLVVETDIINSSSGVITNNGTIEVEGDFDNSAGTLTSSSTSELKFVGAGDSELTAGTHTINKLTLAKDAGANVIVVANDVTVADDITFMNDNNKLVLGTNDLIIEKSTQLLSTGMMSADDNEYIVTNSTGKVTAEGVGASAHTFPVGNSTTTYNPITITENGTADDISVRVFADALEDGATGTVLTENAVAAGWEITEATIGGSDLAVEAGWNNTSDELTSFDPTNSAVLMHDGMDYITTGITFDAAAAVGVRSTNGNSGFVGFSGTKVFIVGDDSFRDGIMVSIKTILAGPYNTGLDNMRDLLRSKSLLPTTEPYSGLAAFTHVGGGGETAMAADFDNVADGDDIVDWVFLEIRDAITPTTVVRTQSALIQRDGDVVDTDGESAVEVQGLTDGNYHIAVRHRNHLGVRTAAPQALAAAAPLTFDFTTSATQAAGSQQQEVETGVFAMHAGNTNGGASSSGAHRFIRMTGSPTVNDYETLLSVLGGIYTASPITNVYQQEDVNMDGNIRMTGSTNVNDYEKLLQSLGGTYTTILNRAF